MTTATDPNAAQATPEAATGTKPTPGETKPATAETKPASGETKAPDSKPTGETLLSKGDAKPGETKPETKPAESKPAEKLALKLAEGSLLNAKEMDAFEADVRELGLPADKAQKLLDREAERRQAFLDSQLTGFKEQQTGWEKQLEAHPTLGGSKLKESDEHATRFVERFGPKGFLDELKKSGFARHPGLFETLANAGRAMAEDKLLPVTSAPTEQKVRSLEDNYK
jgi:hypothetical protein